MNREYPVNIRRICNLSVYPLCIHRELIRASARIRRASVANPFAHPSRIRRASLALRIRRLFVYPPSIRLSVVYPSIRRLFAVYPSIRRLFAVYPSIRRASTANSSAHPRIRRASAANPSAHPLRIRCESLRILANPPSIRLHVWDLYRHPFHHAREEEAPPLLFAS